MLKKFLLAGVAIVATYVSAMAITGEQLGYPIVAGSSYCASFANPTAAVTCNNLIPAGPSLTGNETIKANTNLPSGQNPQTVLLSMASMGALPYSIVNVNATGLTSTVSPLTGSVIIVPTGGLATYGLTLPAAVSLVDGQNLRLTSTLIITAFTLTAGSGTTISNSPTTLVPSTTAPFGYELLYSALTTTWYRVQ